MNREEKMVEVYRSLSEIEAQVIKSLLESYGIPSFLKGNAASSVHMFAVDGMGEVRVMVCESEAEKAVDLIRRGDGDV